MCAKQCGKIIPILDRVYNDESRGSNVELVLSLFGPKQAFPCHVASSSDHYKRAPLYNVLSIVVGETSYYVL